MKKLLLGLFLVLLALPAQAQSVVKPCYPTGDTNASGVTNKTCQDVTLANPFPTQQVFGLTNQSAGGASAIAPWQFEAVQASSNLNAAPTVSAAATPATVTLTGQAAKKICIRNIAIYESVATGAATLTVQDGATVVLDLGAPTLTAAATLFTGVPLVCGSSGNTVTVNIGAGVATEVTHTSVIADTQ